MAPPIHAKVVIIGSGPAGYTAAIYAARAMLDPVLIQGIQPGGQLTITTDVENYPGFADVIQGPWLMEQMEKQAAHVGTKIVTDMVTKLELAAAARSVSPATAATSISPTPSILATGAQARWLGLPSEEDFKGFGVSACATCDGFFYRGKEVVVVGGGNTAVEEAMFLTNFATKVTVIHRRDHFRAERILQDRLFKNPKIKVIWDSAIEEIRGDENPRKVTACRHPERQDRRRSDTSDRRRVHRDRARAGDGACRRPGQDEAVRLRRDRAAFDGDVGPRGVRRRRRRR